MSATIKFQPFRVKNLNLIARLRTEKGFLFESAFHQSTERERGLAIGIENHFNGNSGDNIKLA